MSFVNINGARIFYRTNVFNFSDGRPTLLFIHGAGGSSFTWVEQFHPLKDNFNLIMLDLPEHGHSSGAASDSISDYAEFLKSFLNNFNIKNLVLIGHSMGGAIAQDYALKFPNEIGKLVLVGTGAKLGVAPDIFRAIETSFEQAVKLSTQFALSKDASPSLRENLIRSILKGTPRVMYNDFAACNKFDIRNDVGKIALPALIVVGADDFFTPPKFSRFLHEKIAGSKLQVIDNAGHMVMMEQCEEFNEALIDFIGT